MCSIGNFNGCHGNGSQITNREKMLIFVFCVIFKCNLFPINISKSHIVDRHYICIVFIFKGRYSDLRYLRF